nr:PREDICTED: equilibrative nucleoside transporter 4 [Bos mutus]
MGSVGSQRPREASVARMPDGGVVMSFSFDSGHLEEAVAGATQAQGGRTRGIPIFTDSDLEEPAPDDRYHAIYFAMLLAGVGFLLPYNSFITDVDYLHHKYPGTSIVFDMSLTYILVALAAVLLNNALVERLSLHTRITAGYLLALGPLLFISICDVWLQLFSRDQAYAINLAAVGTVAFGCTVQQSSFYGYTGMLPKRYTQGVMTGETGYRVHHDVAAEDVHFEHQGPALANGGSPKDSPAHEVTGGGAYTRFDVPRPRIRRSWPSFRALLLHRYVVARVIWADMLSIAVTYFITLCLFPGLESEIRHCILGEWLPILLMAVFNLSDFVGKILAALPMDWRGTHLLACSCLRVVFIPLFILCVYPSGTPALRHPAWPCVLSLLMGISNGYFGSVPMILAAGKVGPKQRELAGNTMTVSYMTGLTLGSAVAYCTYSLTRDAHRSCLPPHPCYEGAAAWVRPPRASTTHAPWYPPDATGLGMEEPIPGSADAELAAFAIGTPRPPPPQDLGDLANLPSSLAGRTLHRRTQASLRPTGSPANNRRQPLAALLLLEMSASLQELHPNTRPTPAPEMNHARQPPS